MDSVSLPETEITALLGRGTQFEGTLLIEGRVRLDGRMSGMIQGDATLIIGPGANVRADIDVANVIVKGGTVEGTIRAREAIELYVPSQVRAELVAPSIYIEKGAHFDGTCRMTNAPEPEQEPTGSASPEQDSSAGQTPPVDRDDSP